MPAPASSGTFPCRGHYMEPLISHNAVERGRARGAVSKVWRVIFSHRVAASCCGQLNVAGRVHMCNQLLIAYETFCIPPSPQDGPSWDLWVSSFFLRSLAPIVIGGVSGACARLSFFLFLARPGQDAWVGYSRTAINQSRRRQPSLHSPGTVPALNNSSANWLEYRRVSTRSTSSSCTFLSRPFWFFFIVFFCIAY